MSKQELPKYIYDLLDQISKENNFTDYSVQVRPGSNVGDGFSGELSSVTISEKNGEKQLQLVCKIAPSNKQRRKEFFTEHFFEREAFFYKKLMPTFAKFQEEKNIPKDGQFLAYPKCYAAVIDSENEQFAIILEDLRPKGFTMWNKAKLSPVENLRLSMREIAKFHALSMTMKDQKPDEFADFTKLTDICREAFKTTTFAGMFDASFDRAIESLKRDDHKNIMRQIKANFSVYCESTLSDRSRFAVIAHGDYWNNNILYRFNENNVAEDIGILDWQIIRYVSPAIDIVYNLFTSTDKAFRDKEYENLLQIYYETFSNTVKLLGSDPKKLFTFDDLQSELKEFGNYAFLLVPINTQMTQADSNDLINWDERGNNMGNEESRLEFITGLNEQAQLEYNRRLNEFFEDAVDKLGYYHELI